MENKILKKSTNEQLRTLVQYMEENTLLARGATVFGSNKMSAEEEWKTLCNKLNSLGPPTRSIAEWKKTWADLKSRTKKKIADNKKSLQETGGGLYCHNHLTEFEEIIDRTLFLSSAVPSGKVYGTKIESKQAVPSVKKNQSDLSKSIEDCFLSLVETPPRINKTVAVVTPNRNNGKDLLVEKTLTPQLNDGKNKDYKRKKSNCSDSEAEQGSSSFTKKKKKTTEEQVGLIRRQLRVAERSAETSSKLVGVVLRLAEAVEAQVESAKRSANAAERTTAYLKSIEESTQKI